MRKTIKLSIISFFIIGLILFTSCQDKSLEIEKKDNTGNFKIIEKNEIIEDVGKIESKMIKNNGITDYNILKEYSVFETVENDISKIDIMDMQISEYSLNNKNELPDDIRAVIEENPYLVYFNCKITNISGIDRKDETYGAKLIDSEGNEYLGNFITDSGFNVQLDNKETIDGRIIFNISNIEKKFSVLIVETNADELKVNLKMDE